MNRITVSNLSKTYKGKNALTKVSVCFESGIYALLGPNGAGKTTLLRCITGALSVQEGKVSLYTECDDHTMIGYLPQKFGMYHDLTVWETMELFASLKKIDGDVCSAIEDALKKVNLLVEKKKKIKNLSGGMLRRVGIAQALLGNPQIILLDEPTTGLDPEERIRFRQLIQSLKKDRIVIISTHIVSDVEELCDRVMILNKGSIVFEGKTQDLTMLCSEERGETSLEEGYLCTLNSR